MANTIQIRRKLSTGAPSIGDLSDGEMCLVVPDSNLYQRVNSSTLILLNNVPKTPITANITKSVDFNFSSTNVILEVVLFDPSNGKTYKPQLNLASDRLSGTFKITRTITNAEIDIITR